MTKKQKIKYITDVYYKIAEARNHGRQADNWWYPQANWIAYNVKGFYGFDFEGFRKTLSDRQNEYYQDSDFEDIWYNWLDIEQDDLRSTIHGDDEILPFEITDFVNDTRFAGRSGGWLEVEYRNDLYDLEDRAEYEDIDSTEINKLYKEAKSLEKAETEISKYIEKHIKRLKEYIDTSDFYWDIKDNFILSDEDIADIYKNKIDNLIDKLN